MRKYQMGTRQ